MMSEENLKFIFESQQTSVHNDRIDFNKRDHSIVSRGIIRFF